MTSNKLTPEQQVWRYIRRTNMFVFSDVMIVTGVGYKNLLSFLNEYEALGYIKRLNANKSTTERSYRVLERLPLEVTRRRLSSFRKYSLASIKKVLKYLSTHKETKVSQTLLDTHINMPKSELRACCTLLSDIGVLKTDTSKRARIKNYIVDKEAVKTILRLYEIKDVERISNILDKKSPIHFTDAPTEFIQILKVVLKDEVLKRDELSRAANITRRKLTEWWSILDKTGVIVDSYKESVKERVTYILSAKRAKKVLEALDNGAYEHDRELKQLWVKH